MNEKTKSEARGRDASLADGEYKWGFNSFTWVSFLLKDNQTN